MGILDIIFPKRCVGCGRVGAYFCSSCVKNVLPVAVNEAICPVCGSPAIDGATHPKCHTRYAPDGLTALFHYRGPVRAAIKELKYRSVSHLSASFVELAEASVWKRIPPGEGYRLVPIPLHRTRFRERGYNQAEILGRLAAQKLHIPVSTDILERVRSTVPQVSTKSRVERLNNMNGVFGVKGDKISAGIILFDDVFTTGATVRAATNALKRHGAPFVWAVTMAR